MVDISLSHFFTHKTRGREQIENILRGIFGTFLSVFAVVGLSDGNAKDVFIIFYRKTFSRIRRRTFQSAKERGVQVKRGKSLANEGT